MRFLLILIMLGLVLAGTMFFSEQASAQYPQVADLDAFSASANFMSQAGYLRWQVFQEQGTWISMEEAKSIVKDQMAGM